MDRRCIRWLVAAAALQTASFLTASVTVAEGSGRVAAESAQEVLAGAPSDLSVTVYRAPGRGSGSLNLEYLHGFALIRETRTVRVPAGLSRIRFEGVADGIEPVSSIITGFPSGIVEKNRDAQLLSPSTLIAAAAGKPVMLVRSNAKSGKIERVPGTILSDSEGVVFKTEVGLEALDRAAIPVQRIYGIDLLSWSDPQFDPISQPASVLLRTRNNAANHLGLPLPSGTVAVFGLGQRGPLLLNESGITDLALDEEVEIDMGTSADVQVKALVEKVKFGDPPVRKIPLLPGIVLRKFEVDDSRRVEVSNARDSAVQFELRLLLDEGARVIGADHPVAKKNGRPVFNLTVPAHRTVKVRYQTGREEVEPEAEPEDEPQ